MLTDDTPQTCWVVLLTLPIFEISDKSIVISSNTARSPHLIQARMLPRSHTKKPSHLITGLSLSQSIIVGREQACIPFHRLLLRQVSPTYSTREAAESMMKYRQASPGLSTGIL